MRRATSRDAEIAAINQLLDSARAGRGGGLVLRGEPGIGKSALLRESVGMASGMCVLRATGVEAESALTHAVLHQLLHPIQQYAADLPAPQRDALQVALGLAAGAATD